VVDFVGAGPRAAKEPSGAAAPIPADAAGAAIATLHGHLHDHVQQNDTSTGMLRLWMQQLGQFSRTSLVRPVNEKEHESNIFTNRRWSLVAKGSTLTGSYLPGHALLIHFFLMAYYARAGDDIVRLRASALAPHSRATPRAEVTEGLEPAPSAGGFEEQRHHGGHQRHILHAIVGEYTPALRRFR
jgi:hypothetical protein